MKPSRWPALIVALGFASPLPADPVACPETGNPGTIGGSGTFVAIDPPVPETTESVRLTVGEPGFDPGTLSAQVDGNTINVLLAGRAGGFTTPPQTTCLSTDVGPLVAGSHTLKVIVLPDDATPPYVAATSPLVVELAPEGASVAITGLMTSNWYDPHHVGEGIVVQIAAYPPTPEGVIHNAFVFDWFTFDEAGHPFWIAGNVTIGPDEPTSVTSPAVYSTDGGFAGNFGADATQNPWGTVTFRFSDLDHMTVDYAADTGLPAGIPAGTGTLQFQRLLDVAGLCRPPMICIQ